MKLVKQYEMYYGLFIIYFCYHTATVHETDTNAEIFYFCLRGNMETLRQNHLVAQTNGKVISKTAYGHFKEILIICA